MTVIFETAGGQSLKAELSDEDFDAFVERVKRACINVRNQSIKDVGIANFVRHEFQNYTLRAREQLQ